MSKRPFAYLMLFLFFQSWGTIVFSQISSAKPVVIELRDNNGEAISDVYAFNEEKNQLIGISQNGKINGYVSTQMRTITLSHISFESQKLSINTEDWRNADTLKYWIVLKKKIVLLEEVGITAKSPTRLAYNREKDYVEDYAFYGDEILILLKAGKHGKLKLIDQNGESKMQVNVADGAKSLFRDCFKNVHVLFKDSVRQVLVLQDTIVFLTAYSTNVFENSLALCQAKSANSFIIGYRGQFDQQVDLFIKQDQEEEYHHFRTSRNPIFQARARRFAQAFAGDLTGAAGVKTRMELDGVRALDRAYTYFKYVESKPIYVPVFHYKKVYLVFDHPKDSLLYFTASGHPIKGVGIVHHRLNNWKNKVLFDEQLGNFYSHHVKGSRSTIIPINIETGEPGEAIKIKKAFYSKLKVRNNKAYYLYKDMSGYTNQQFYVQDL